MIATDRRGVALRALDDHVRDFTQACAARFEAGSALARADVDRLVTLAERLTSDIQTWNQALLALEVSRDGAFDPARTGQVIVECALDDVLTPAAARVLAAALDLTWRPS
jgi:hypothetical protein